MLSQLRKITMDQWFAICVFILSIILSFMLGYVLFRYTQIELCKSPVTIARDSF